MRLEKGMNSRVCFLLCLVLATSGLSASAAPLASGTAITRAVMKYFGKEGIEEGTEYLAKQGGREMAERLSAAALREGGEEAVEELSKLAAKHGPELLRALDNAPQVAPIMAALRELPEAQARAAMVRLAAGTGGRELAESVVKNGAAALRSELLHPGVGNLLAKTLGQEGAEMATRLTTDQAVMVARHADDLVALPASQRKSVLALIRNDTERVVSFLGRFAADNPGKTLFTVATTTVLLAESERILGGDEIVFDADGNPVVVTKAGLAGRTMKVGGEALGKISDDYIRPLYQIVLVFLAAFAGLFLLTRFLPKRASE
ncbi:MAG: hypothetical protein AAFV88_23380 [Planctomycetota bacterium]